MDTPGTKLSLVEVPVVCTTDLPVRPPRWDGDCIHCSAMGIPPGMSLICPSCGYTVCAGHMGKHNTLEGNESPYMQADADSFVPDLNPDNIPPGTRALGQALLERNEPASERSQT